jgi:hypothetical protein
MAKEPSVSPNWQIDLACWEAKLFRRPTNATEDDVPVRMDLGWQFLRITRSERALAQKKQFAELFCCDSDDLPRFMAGGRQLCHRVQDLHIVMVLSGCRPMGPSSGRQFADGDTDDQEQHFGDYICSLSDSERSVRTGQKEVK